MGNIHIVPPYLGVIYHVPLPQRKSLITTSDVRIDITSELVEN